MAVRVIEEKPDASVVKQAVCRNCGVKVEYLPLDVKSRHGQDYSGGPDGCEWVDCPNCKGAIVLKSW